MRSATIIGLSAVLASSSTPLWARDIGPGGLPCGFSVTVIEGPSHPIFSKPSVTPVDINDSGVVVGYYSWIGDIPFMWSERTGFVTLTPPVGVAYARATKINNNGWILVAAEVNTAGARSFVVTGDGQWIQLDPPGGSGHLTARGINDSNVVVGRFRVIPPEGPWGEFRCFIWTLEGGMEIVEVEPGPACGCEAINAGGTIVGWVGEGEFTVGSVGFVRDFDGTIGLMPPIPGGVSSSPRAISDEEVVVGWGQYSTSPITVRGFVYVDKQMLHRIDPEPGFVNTHIHDIMPGGVLAGRQFTPGAGGMSEPGLWTPALGWRHLDSMVDTKLGFNLNGSGRASDRGVLTANASKWEGQTNNYYGLMLTPVTEPPDFNCNGEVEVSDLFGLLEHWDVQGGFFDLNGDMVVDGIDLGMLLGQWTG